MSDVHGSCSRHPRRDGLPALPAAVRCWLEAHATHDVDREVSALCEDVVVAADGRLFFGRAAACDWSRQACAVEPSLLAVSFVTRGDACLVTFHLDGPDAGVSTEVTYCFLLSGDLIRGVAVAA